MKVLMFGWEFPPHISGGLGTACHGLTKGLAHLGVDIDFVIPKLNERKAGSHVNFVDADSSVFTGQPTFIETVKTHLKTIAIDSPLMPYLNAKSYDALFPTTTEPGQATHDPVTPMSSGNYGPNLMTEIFRYNVVAELVAKAQTFDIIHAHDWMTFKAGITAKKASGKPLIIHVHALEFDRSGENINPEIFAIEKQGMLESDLIIAVSHYTKDLIIKHYGIPSSKVRVVHNAVSKEKLIQTFHIQRHLSEKVVLFLGRITFQKGPDYFLEAAKKVLDRMDNVRFVMTGSGDMYTQMIERMAALRIGNKFHFTGFLRGADVEKMYALSDLYVMPSVSEPFGIAPLEAMVYNIPIIISKQSGVAEILPDVIKVDFWDTDKLAEHIMVLLSKPQVAQTMTQKNAQQLREIKWEKAAEKVFDIYNEFLKAP